MTKDPVLAPTVRPLLLPLMKAELKKLNLDSDDVAKTLQLARFVDSAFDFKKFPKTVYTWLSTRFQHIAHYNREGFYDSWFSVNRDRAAWLKKVEAWRPYREGYHDEEIAIIAAVKASGLADYWKQVSDAQNDVMARAQLARLKAEYE